ncbi:hypothetical protein OYC64_017873 [Pagothenia borchgrevinki]|uniref:Uncharacterized protein n=1 Tax=Pagothenia borchgrevinki TaxID=8213 RepID=A0ABD2GNN1_PAGBO
MQEKSIRNTEPAQQSGVSCVSLWPRARRPPKDGPCVALSAAAPAPQTGPQSRTPLAVCGSAEGDLSPNNTRLLMMGNDWLNNF